jgi:hypothetical protein
MMISCLLSVVPSCLQVTFSCLSPREFYHLHGSRGCEVCRERARLRRRSVPTLRTFAQTPLSARSVMAGGPYAMLPSRIHIYPIYVSPFETHHFKVRDPVCYSWVTKNLGPLSLGHHYLFIYSHSLATLRLWRFTWASKSLHSAHTTDVFDL